jgi:glycosyltransferase involved in cell wall biosynthesis
VNDLRVALLHPCYWPEVQRGVERLIHEHATDLIAAGNSAHLITSHPGPPSRSVEEGLEITRHWRPPDGMLRRRGFQEYVTHLPFTYLSLMAGEHDVAHAFFPGEAAIARRWAERRGRPSLFTYPGLPERQSLSSRRGRLRLLTEAVRESDAVVALTRAAADAIRRWFGVDPHVIPPGVRLERFGPTSGRDERPTIVCTAAPDDSRKRVDLLIRAFGLVRRERRDARLVFAPPLGVAVDDSLGDGIEVNPVPPDRVPEVYQRAWVTALPSRNEAFGLVLVESLACGTPVVGTRDGGIPEIVDRDGIGRLFDGAEEELARALLETFELALDPGTVGACRARAADFTTQAATGRYLELYRELL